MTAIKDYIKIARPDHWIKQLFIVPGALLGLFMIKPETYDVPVRTFLLAFVATCFIASANYVINEWLDADFDKYHPTKKNRPVVAATLSAKLIILEYLVLGILGLIVAYIASRLVFYMELWLFVMGILYNVKPIRTKEIIYIDVLSESINNAIRLLIGWFAITSLYFPPISIVLGYWMGGAFLMAVKRYAEYRMIGNPEVAGLYRKSFKYYTENSLLLSAFYYGLMSVFFCGIFMIKYKIEFIFAIPLLCGLFCYYLNLSNKQDSSVQKPEKLFKEKGLMLYLLFFIVAVIALLLWDSSGLQFLLDTALIGV